MKPFASDIAEFANIRWPAIAAWSRAAGQLMGWNLPSPLIVRRPSRLAVGLLFFGSFLPTYATVHFLGDTTPVWASNAG